MSSPVGSKPQSVLVRDGQPGGEGPVEMDADTGARRAGATRSYTRQGKCVPESPWRACGPDDTLTLDVQSPEL